MRPAPPPCAAGAARRPRSIPRGRFVTPLTTICRAFLVARRLADVLCRQCSDTGAAAAGRVTRGLASEAGPLPCRSPARSEWRPLPPPPPPAATLPPWHVACMLPSLPPHGPGQLPAPGLQLPVGRLELAGVGGGQPALPRGRPATLGRRPPGGRYVSHGCVPPRLCASMWCWGAFLDVVLYHPRSHRCAVSMHPPLPQKLFNTSFVEGTLAPP